MTRKKIGPLVAIHILVLLGGCLPDYPVDRLRERAGSAQDTAGSRAPDSDDPSSQAAVAALYSTPDFGPTVRQADPPPPLSGGTLAVAPDGKTVVAADPDRDRVYIVDWHDASKLRTVALSVHDEPGRVVVDASRRAHVALRKGGAFVTIDLALGTIVARRDVCTAPRGIAYDPATDVVHVACAGGELVTFPAAGGAEVRRRMLVRDLRDVVVVPGGLVVSTFRDARTYRLDDGDSIAFERRRFEDPNAGVPAVAWRMIALPSPGLWGPDDDMLIAQQRVPSSGDDGSAAPPPPSAPAAYYGGPALNGTCNVSGSGPMIMDGIHESYVPDAALPVDAAASSAYVAVVAAANGHTASLPQLVFLDRRSVVTPGVPSFDCFAYTSTLAFPGLQLTSVAFAAEDTLVALSREPAALVMVHMDPETYGKEVARIPLGGDSREDTGHAIFHANSGSGVACASCHPDGRDDGHAWRSLDLGARRTPSLLGTLAGTAPYHWNGEAADLTALMQLTFESRMHGPALSPEREDAIGGWLRALAAPPAAKPVDAVAAARGQALFEGAAACATCHSGAMRTNNATLDVGTGGAFQVPSLVGVSWRAPFLHDGSAPTLRAVLQRAHGGVVPSAAQASDLEAYVGTF